MQRVDQISVLPVHTAGVRDAMSSCAVHDAGADHRVGGRRRADRRVRPREAVGYREAARSAIGPLSQTPMRDLPSSGSPPGAGAIALRVVSGRLGSTRSRPSVSRSRRQDHPPSGEHLEGSQAGGTTVPRDPQAAAAGISPKLPNLQSVFLFAAPPGPILSDEDRATVSEINARAKRKQDTSCSNTSDHGHEIPMSMLSMT
jgi:hypothetical protein